MEVSGRDARGPRDAVPITVDGGVAMSSPRPARAPRGWHSRGYLPHFDAGEENTQFVTFRLADSVPAKVLAGWIQELLGRPERERELELRRLIETYLDSGYGACHLRHPAIAELVEGAMLHFDAKRYTLHAWVVMPNHVHVVFTPAVGESLSSIVHSWKSFTSKQANTILGRDGQLWHEDYYDRFVRTESHFQIVVDYTENNPVGAGLCREPSDWQYGSAFRRGALAGGTPVVPGGTA
jgi:REP element-mobilizing transposase RayT